MWAWVALQQQNQRLWVALFHHTGCQWEAKREWRLGAWGEWRRVERKEGFCIFSRAILQEHSLLVSEICKETSLFCISPLCINQPKSKNFSNITKWTQYGPVFGVAWNSHISVLAWVPARKVPTIPTDNVQNWLTPIVEPF